jgi:hypothetical protein
VGGNADRATVTHRSFKDKQGRIWDVWQVHPSAAERRFVQRRVKDENRSDAPERRSGDDRRIGEQGHGLPRATIAPEFTYGWLCFETSGEKRRLAPVPDGWDRADDETIEQWCCTAKAVTRRKTDPMQRRIEPR